MQSSYEILNAESERKKREQASIANAHNGYVVAVINGERVAVDPKTITVNGVNLASMLDRLIIAEDLIKALQATTLALAKKDNVLQSALNMAQDKIDVNHKRAIDNRTLIDQAISRFDTNVAALQESDKAQATMLNKIYETLKGVKL